ncbi:MAG: BMP family protein [Nitrososphaeria archaeon]
MKRRSISSAAIAIMVIVIIVVAGVAGYYYYMNMQAKKSKPQVVKIAVLLPYVVNDYGWNQNMYQAIAQIASVYHINYTVDQNLGYSPSAVESALEYYASNGYNIIVAWTVGWQQEVLTVAPKYPNVWFIGADLTNFTNPTTGQPEKNVVSIAIDLIDGAYAAGVLAAFLTKTGIIGYQAGFSYPIEVAIGNAFLQGALSVNKNIKLVYDFPGTWADVEKGYIGAKSLIAAGADVILFRGDGQTLGGEQACAAAGVYAIGDMVDQSPLNPNVIVASNYFNDTLVLQEVLERYYNGTLSEWADQNVVIPGSNYLLLGPAAYKLLTPQQLNYVEQVIEGIKNGTIVVPYNATLPPSGAV